jgi:hypothetical protein
MAPARAGYVWNCLPGERRRSQRLRGGLGLANARLPAQRRERRSAMGRLTGMKLWWVGVVLAGALASCGQSSGASDEVPHDVQGTEASTSAGTAADQALAHISGRAVMWLGCPLEDSRCAPTGVAAHIEVRSARPAKVVARSDTDEAGRFELDLPLGSYVVMARVVNGPPAEPIRMPLTVHADHHDTLVLRFHADIRRPSPDDVS